jgi:hypothetical protein
MDRFSPEFAQRWIADRHDAADAMPVDRAADELPSPAQQEALDELAERVLAARSVY